MSGYKANQEKKDNPSELHPVGPVHVYIVPCMRPGCFPWLPLGLMYCLCGLETVEQPHKNPANPTKGLDPPFRVKIKYSSVQCQFRKGEGALATGPEGESDNLCLCEPTLGVETQCWGEGLYCTVQRNSLRQKR